MAVRYVSGPLGTEGRSSTVGTNTTPTLSEPAFARKGLFYLSQAVSDLAGNIQSPAGWTILYNGSGTVSKYVVAYIIRGDTAPSLVWSLTGSTYREVFIAAFEGTDAAITINAQSSTGSYQTSNVGPDPGPVTMTSPNGLSVCFGFNNGATLGWSETGGYAAATDGASGNDTSIWWKSLSAPGIEDPPQFTNGSLTSNDTWNGATIILSDVQVPPPVYTSAPAFIKKTTPKQQRLDDA